MIAVYVEPTGLMTHRYVGFSDVDSYANSALVDGLYLLCHLGPAVFCGGNTPLGAQGSLHVDRVTPEIFTHTTIALHLPGCATQRSPRSPFVRREPGS
jgi:hypothetical protein